jgi:hypothetical protein
MPVQSFPAYESSTEYSHMGRNFGNPMLDLMMSMMFGNNLMPSRDSGQSMYDALIQRERSQHFLELQRSGGANNMMFKALGINNNPIANIMSSMAMSSPDSAMGKLMSPLLGGNPMAASMQIYGGFSGANIMGNFGRTNDITVQETESVMDALMNNMYKTQQYEGPGGAKEEINNKTRQKLFDLAETKSKQNDEYLQKMGINVTRNADGKISDDTRKQIEKFEIPSGGLSEKEIAQNRQATASKVNSDISAMLNASDDATAEALDKRVEEQLKAHGIATADQIKNARNSGDKATYASKIREYLDKYEVSGGDVNTPESKETRKKLVEALQPNLKELAKTEAQQATEKSKASADFETKLQATGISALEIERLKVGGTIDPAKAAEMFKKDAEKAEAHKKVAEGLKPDLEKLEKIQTQQAQTQQAQTQQAAEKSKVSSALEKKLYGAGFLAPEIEQLKVGGTIDPAKLTDALKKIETKDETKRKAIENLQPDLKGLEQAQTQQAAEKSKVSSGLETKLKDAGIPPAQIEKIKVGGSIDATKAVEILKQFEEGALESKSAKDEEIESNIRTKRTTASKLASELAEVQNLDEEDKTKSDRIKSLRERMTKELNLSDKEAGEIFDEDRGTFSPKGISSKGEEKAKKAIRKSSELTPVEEGYQEMKAAKDGEKRYRGYKFENTMGFKAEDFTSAFVQASNLRMLGDSRGSSVAGKMADFSKHAGGTMDAARSLFGDKSGAELLSKISDMTGSSVDLSSAKGNAEAEKLLRDVKATAEVAGVSINTMLSIIDATKELAANNPRLSGIGAATTTNMAVNAVARAADIGASMSAKEYRQAGGSQTIAADEVASTQAFMSSGLGQQIAAISGLTAGLGTMVDEEGKEYDPHEKIVEMIRKGEITADTLNSGEAFDKIEKITKGKITRDDVLRGATNKETIKAGMQDEATTKAMEESTNAVVNDQFWKSAETFGFSQEEYRKTVLEEQAKGEKGKTASQIFDTMSRNMPEELRATYKGRAVRQILDETRGPEERDRVQKRKDERSAADARISRVYAANYSPISQQLIGAIMEGKDFGETADIMGGIFATRDYKKEDTKAAIQKARDAGSEIAKISAKAEGSQEELKARGLDKAMNKFIQGRKTEAEALGEKDATHLSGDISMEEYEQEAKNLRHADKTSTAKEALATLKDLEALDKKGKLNETEKESLAALRTAKKAGHLDSDAALKLAKSGTLEGLGAATIQAQTDKNIERVKKEEKTRVLDRLGGDLQEASTQPGGTEIKDALAFYEKQGLTGSSAIQKMYEDYQNPTKGAGNFFKDQVTGEAKKLDPKGVLATSLRGAADDISKTERKVDSDRGKGAGGPNKELSDALNGLKEMIKSGGGIGDALGKLATALKKLN